MHRLLILVCLSFVVFARRRRVKRSVYIVCVGHILEDVRRGGMEGRRITRRENTRLIHRRARGEGGRRRCRPSQKEREKHGKKRNRWIKAWSTSYTTSSSLFHFLRCSMGHSRLGRWTLSNPLDAGLGDRSTVGTLQRQKTAPPMYNT